VLSHDQHWSLICCGTCGDCRLNGALATFFSIAPVLRGLAAGMSGTRHQCTPPMTSEQAVNRAVIDLVSDLDWHSLAGFSLREQSLRSEHARRTVPRSAVLLLSGDVPTTSLPRSLNRTHSKAIVERDDLMDCRFRHSAMLGNLFRGCRGSIRALYIMSQRFLHQTRGSLCNRLFTSSMDT
jgi:hypothetical protein